MCVAIAIPEGAPFPDLETMEACEWTNDDGIGIAFPDGNGRVEFFKDLSLPELMDLGALTEGLSRLVHFRLATSGGVRPELCHPFPLTKTADVRLRGTAPRVLIHNGVWSDWDLAADLMAPLPAGPWSDTRLMARIIALHGDSWIRRFVGEERVGRLATLDGEGNIGLAGDWEMDDDTGVWFSNTYWQWRYGGSRYTWPSDVGSHSTSTRTASDDGPTGGYLTGSDDETRRYVDYLKRTSEGETVMTKSEYTDWWKSQGRSTRQERYGEPEDLEAALADTVRLTK